MGLQRWKLLKEEDVSPSNYFKVFKHTVELPDGKVVDDYFISKLGDVSTIIAVTDEKKIIFVRQYKQGLRDLTIELPAGKIRKGSTPLEAAQMELLEETGYTAENFTEIGGVCPWPSKDGSIVYGFIATNLSDTGKKHFDELEDIELIYLTKSEVEEYIKQGKIVGSDAIALFFKAVISHPELF